MTDTTFSHRVLKVSGTEIVLDASLNTLTHDEIRKRHQGLYPELTNATIKATIKDGVEVIEAAPLPGRKG